jgi:putative GTP pyrophosphokinase
MASLHFEQEEHLFAAFYASQAPLLHTLCQGLQKHIAGLLGQSHGVAGVKVEGRVKDPDECLRKFSSKYRYALEEANQPYAIRDHLTDLIGIRVVCLYEDEIWKVADLIRPCFKVIEITDKIAKVEGTDDSFGYKGLHLDLACRPEDAGLEPGQPLPVGQFELQVRTIIQDSWSVLDHQIKYKKSIPSSLKRRINVLAALFELADREFRQIRDETEAGLQSALDETALPEASPEGRLAVRDGQPPSELNAFTFLKIVNHFFKEFAFEPAKVDGFVDNIKSWSPDISRGDFNSMVRHQIGTVKRYKQFFEERNEGLKFNPYTVIRHCLYLGDKETFTPALRRNAKEAFDAWLALNPPPARPGTEA